jgi:HPt (histidine-containing phosphotransfer) domain-containing protein
MVYDHYMARNQKIDSEIIENVDSLESYLIAYEGLLSQGRDDTSQVQFIFRYAHNLKSSLAMTGLRESSELLHHAESCFDLVRSAKRKATLELTKVSIQMVDILRLHFENLDAPFPDCSKIVETMELFVKSENKDDLYIDIPFPLIISEIKLVSQAVKEGKNLWLLQKLITTSIPEDFYEMLPSFEEAQKAGTLIAFSPQWKDLPKSSNECVLQLLIASDLDKKAIAKISHDPLRPVRIKKTPRYYLSNELGKDIQYILDTHDFKACSEIPMHGRCILAVNMDREGCSDEQPCLRPDIAVLAIGKYTADDEDILRCIDQGADAVSAGSAQIKESIEWLETLMFTKAIAKEEAKS